MRRLTVVLAALILLASTAAWGHDEKLQAELLDEVLRLTQAQVPNEVVLEQIKAWGFVFELNADDIVELRSLGVSDDVLDALIGTANDENMEVHTQSQVVFSAGYYAPWYWYPVAWGGYYDPFPSLYCSYYYPFHYSAHFGYYGWCGGTYYAHYYPNTWGREAWHAGRRVPGAPYSVAGGLTARRAGTMTVPTSGGMRSREATPRIIRNGTQASTALRRGELRSVERQRGAPTATPVGARRGGFDRGRSNAARQEIARRQGNGFRTMTPAGQARVAAPTRWRSSGGSANRSFQGFSARSRGSLSSPGAAPRFQSMPRGGSMPRMSAPPAAISARFGAARGR